MAATGTIPNVIIDSHLVVNNASGTSAQTAYTAPAGGARIDKIIATSTDTSARDMQILLNGNLIGTVSVPIGAGNTSGAAAKDVLADSNMVAPVDPYGNKVIYLSNGETLQVLMPVAVTAAKQIVVTVMGGAH
jgi:hypothetical protein